MTLIYQQALVIISKNVNLVYVYVAIVYGSYCKPKIVGHPWVHNWISRYVSKYQVTADMCTVGYAGYVLQGDDHKAKLCLWRFIAFLL